jgi:hypothetical protein
MWRPESWNDVEGMLGQAVELSTLEFKRELGSGARPNAELAKDIASMTLTRPSLLATAATPTPR